jgi:hypothetical protein
MAARFREFTAMQVRVSIDRIEPQIWRQMDIPLEAERMLRKFAAMETKETRYEKVHGSVHGFGRRL